MCDLQVVNWALEAWLIPDVVQVKCEKELRFPGDLLRGLGSTTQWCGSCPRQVSRDTDG